MSRSYTEDRGRAWQGPFEVPTFGHQGSRRVTVYYFNDRPEQER